MSDLRAILVSREQRDAVEIFHFEEDTLELTGEQLLGLRQLLLAFDAAGDQPRIRWCAKHGQVRWGYCYGAGYMDPPCRVVDAIVVPLPEQP